jgi:hypothetical protein
MVSHAKKLTPRLKSPCGNILRQFNEYISGELSPSLRAEVEAHIRKCKTCDCVMETIRETVALYRAMPDVKLPAGTRRKLERSIKGRLLGGQKHLSALHRRKRFVSQKAMKDREGGVAVHSNDRWRP